MESHEKEVKDINPNLKQDDQSLNISIVDFSTERNKEYLSKLVRKLVNSNYYDNLKKIDIYHNEKSRGRKIILIFQESINTKEEYELINLGVIFHGINTDHKNYYKFQIYKVNPNSLLYSKVKPADEILNIIKNDDLKNDLDEKEYCYYSKVGGNIEKRLKSKLNNILKENNEIIIILKKYDTQKIEFLEISKQELLEYRSKILKEFDNIELKRKNFQKTIKINTIQKNLDKFSENITELDYFDYEKEFEKSNCIILLNETNQQIQKFRENPIEDHGMINNFVGFSKVRRHHPEKNQSLITEVNGFRTKKILQDFKYKYYSPFIGNDVVEMNSIVSKYIAAATFDLKHTDLINLLFKRVHTLKSHTLLDKSLSTTFCELEKYFQNKNEVLIGIIDYDFIYQEEKLKIYQLTPNKDNKLI